LGIVVGIIIALPVFLIVFPAAAGFALGNGQTSTPIYLGVICFCLYLPVLLLLNGILVAYTESAWTLTYMRLTRNPEAGELLNPDNVPPAEPGDGNKTIVAAEPKDSERTVIAKKPDA